LYSPGEPAGKTAHARSPADVTKDGLRDRPSASEDHGSLQSREQPQLLQTILHCRSSMRSPQRSQMWTHWAPAEDGAQSVRTRVGDGLGRGSMPLVHYPAWPTSGKI
jgi:hypothetical protein